jgi:hypothetical protein
MKNEIVKKVGGVISKFGFGLRKHSPEILITIGVIGTVASAVIACKASTKVSTIIEDTKEQLDAVHEAKSKYIDNDADNEDTIYTQEDVKKDTAIIYIQTGVKLAKLYVPAVMLGALSLSCIIVSNNILRKRNIALAAAYTALDTSFKEYRERVTEKFGEEVDKQLRHGIKAIDITETSFDKNGNETTSTKTVNVIEGCSDYARYFEASTSPYWEKESAYNELFIEAQQNYANDRLKANGYLFLNDVYESLGFEKTKAGQVVGWVYDPENPNGDNYIDFGIMNIHRSDGDEYRPTILLDFNVDGNILDLMEGHRKR